MTEKEVVVDLLVDLGIAFTKAAERLAGSRSVGPTTKVANAVATEDIKEGAVVKEVKDEPKTQEGFGLAGMSAKEAMALVTATEDEATLKAIGTEEKGRGSKARKGVMTAVQAKLDKLKNPPAQAEVATTEKAFTSTNPATTPEDVKLFTLQFNKMSEAQRNQYFNGEIDSTGKPLNGAAPASNDEEFEDLGLGEQAPATAAPSVTAEELRAKLQAYAKANGPEKAYAVLAHYGVKKIKDLDPSQYGEVAMELE